MENSQISNTVLEAADDKVQGMVADSLSNTTLTATSNDSIFSYFWNAGLLIKIVMLTLLISSVYSWSIIFTKYLKLKRLRFDANCFEEDFWSGSPIDSLYKELKESVFDPMANVFCAAMAEWESFTKRYGDNDFSTTNILEKRLDRAMQIAIKKEIDELEKGTSFLSSLGTNGVIIGLFGTVIGILNGFKVIAVQQSASLASVAPVISEALFTTALGFVAALPAAIAYNKVMDSINNYVNRLEVFSEEFTSILLRQIDER
ncbi:MAG: MotA/TolQ/ExbB proton channel family protein [Holosporales bacterium]|jgi:biopolymer transport protein TolQ|nr:MotA/TolQ/ExbB proton channel family protein [Holosporales bacterium]